MIKTTLKKSIRRIALLLTALLALAGSSDAAFAVSADAAPPACPCVRIAFIDSGISTRHIDESLVEPGRNYVFPEADTRDRIGHGTAAASLVVGSTIRECPERLASLRKTAGGASLKTSPACLKSISPSPQGR